MKATQITLALVAAFAAVAVQAQSLTKPGVEAGNIDARGTVNGAINQVGGGTLVLLNGRGGRDLAPGGGSIISGGQNVRVGGVAGIVQASRINASGTVNGAITQLRAGALEGGNEQLVSIGSVSNTTANNVTATGTVTGIVLQSGGSAASGFNLQALQVGGVDDVKANNVNATGTLTGTADR